MKGAFLFGLGISGFGILVSLLSGDWEVAFALSGTAAGIAIVISGIIRNFSVIKMRRDRTGKKEANKTVIAAEDEYWLKVFAAFSAPNIILAVILYFLLYR